MRLPGTISAILSHDIKANDQREDYQRARITDEENGTPVIELISNQDSSLLSALSSANCLLKRAPFAAPVAKGERVNIIPLDEGYPLC